MLRIQRILLTFFDSLASTVHCGAVIVLSLLRKYLIMQLRRLWCFFVWYRQHMVITSERTRFAHEPKRRIQSIRAVDDQSEHICSAYPSQHPHTLKKHMVDTPHTMFKHWQSIARRKTVTSFRNSAYMYTSYVARPTRTSLAGLSESICAIPS